MSWVHFGLKFTINWKKNGHLSPFSLVTQLCQTLCDPTDCRMPFILFLGFSRQEYWSGLPFPVTVATSICHEVMGPEAMILVFWMLSVKTPFSLSSFTFIKRLFSSSLLSAIRVVPSAYLRLLMFLPAVLIPAYAPMDHVFSELSTMTCLFWVALHLEGKLWPT